MLTMGVLLRKSVCVTLPQQLTQVGLCDCLKDEKIILPNKKPLTFSEVSGSLLLIYAISSSSSFRNKQNPITTKKIKASG